MTRRLIIILIVFSSITQAKGDDEIRNTRFPLCVEELLKMAPPDLVKDIEHRGGYPEYPCYFGLHDSDDVLNSEISPGQYKFDLDLARKMCDRLGAAVITIQNSSEQYAANSIKDGDLSDDYLYALGAEVEFVRNEEKRGRSMWKVTKWDDARSKHLHGKDIECDDPASASDTGILVHRPTAGFSVYFVVLTRVGLSEKIHLRCKQDTEKLLTDLKSPEPPVTPEPGVAVRNVNICNKTSVSMHLPKELLDRIESSAQLKMDPSYEPHRCYFQLDQQTMDKANLQFQKGFYRFSFPYARMMCDKFGAQLLSFAEQHEIDQLSKKYEHWKTEEFYAIGATIHPPSRDHMKNYVVHYFAIQFDKVGIHRMGQTPWGYSIPGVYHTDEKDVGGLVYSQNNGWFVVQNSAGFYKAVRIICVQNLDDLDQNDQRVGTGDGDWTRPSVTPTNGRGESTSKGSGQDGSSPKSTHDVDDTTEKPRKGPSPTPPSRLSTSRSPNPKIGGPGKATTSGGTKEFCRAAVIAIGLATKIACG